MQSFLKDQLGQLGMKLVDKNVWQGYSPDLNAVWSCLKLDVQGQGGRAGKLDELIGRGFNQ